MQEIEPKELQQKIQNGDNIKIIDVRELHELKDTGKIPGASHIRQNILSEILLQERGYQKDDQIVMNCRSGGRSGETTKLLEHWGYTNVSNLVGGITQWREDGFDVEAVK